MSLYYLCSKWTQHAVWRSSTTIPVCCRPSTLHHHPQPRDPGRGEPGHLERFNLDIFLINFKYISLSLPSGGWCWQPVQHQRCNCGQHRDRWYDIRHCGLERSPAGYWLSSSASLWRFPPSFCALHPHTLTGQLGPDQAEPLSLLWAQLSARQSSHGQLRHQVWKGFTEGFSVCFLNQWQCASVSNCYFFLLQSQFSYSGDGQWERELWNKVSHFLTLVWLAQWKQNGSVPPFFWPHFRSQAICRISMWNFPKSKTPHQPFIKHLAWHQKT